MAGQFNFIGFLWNLEALNTLTPCGNVPCSLPLRVLYDFSTRITRPKLSNLKNCHETGSNDPNGHHHVLVSYHIGCCSSITKDILFGPLYSRLRSIGTGVRITSIAGWLRNKLRQNAPATRRVHAWSGERLSMESNRNNSRTGLLACPVWVQFSAVSSSVIRNLAALASSTQSGL